jgi:septal ring factor EnvC (AmiA/AmiB activator)
MLLLLSASNARAEDPVKPEQLKKAYDNALVQLKAAQDRKAELAKENDTLAARVAELQKQLAESQATVETLRREIADGDERTFYLRSYHAAWESFIRRYPAVMFRWQSYLGDGILTPPQEVPDGLNGDWSLPSAG